MKTSHADKHIFTLLTKYNQTVKHATKCLQTKSRDARV